MHTAIAMTDQPRRHCKNIQATARKPATQTFKQPVVAGETSSSNGYKKITANDALCDHGGRAIFARKKQNTIVHQVLKFQRLYAQWRKHAYRDRHVLRALALMHCSSCCISPGACCFPAAKHTG